MAKYFYYNEKGEKKGAFSGKEIKALAKAGLINPQTIIETEEGKQYYAHGIGGVEFGAVPVSNENKPTEERQDSNTIAPKRNNTISIKPLSIPKWIDDVYERRSPGGFVGSIGANIGLANFVFGILFLVGILSLVMGVYMIKNAGLFGSELLIGTYLIVYGVFDLSFVLLFQGLICNFLRSIRATFCHQFVVEQHVAKQTEYLQMLAEIQMPANGVYVLEE